MKILMEITYTDHTVVTKWLPIAPKEATDKLGPGKYDEVHGRPKQIKESRALCWDIDGEVKQCTYIKLD